MNLGPLSAGLIDGPINEIKMGYQELFLIFDIKMASQLFCSVFEKKKMQFQIIIKK